MTKSLMILRGGVLLTVNILGECSTFSYSKVKHNANVLHYSIQPGGGGEWKLRVPKARETSRGIQGNPLNIEPMKCHFVNVVLSVRCRILTVKHIEVWDRSKYRSSLRRDFAQGFNVFWCINILSCIIIYHAFGCITILSCITIYHASLYIMHRYKSCIIIYDLFWCITIYHESVYIMRFDASLYIIHH